MTNTMAQLNPASEKPDDSPAPMRVTTMISCAGVRSLARQNDVPRRPVANENRWFDKVGFRRRWYANIAAIGVALALLVGGVWIVSEFARLQKIAACFEAGRQNCMPLDMARRGR